MAYINEHLTEVFAAGDLKTARRAYSACGLMVWSVFAFFICTVGLLSKALFLEIEKDLAWITCVAKASPAGITGLIVSAFGAAIMSTGAGAFAIETQEGGIVYTGDLRLHGTRSADTPSFFEEASKLKPLALICEGTHPHTETPYTEENVYKRVAETVGKSEVS